MSKLDIKKVSEIAKRIDLEVLEGEGQNFLPLDVFWNEIKLLLTEIENLTT